MKKNSTDLYREQRERKDLSDSLLSDYISQRASYLANELEEGKPCPVCGSLTHPMPAQESEGAVTIEEVENAQNDVEEIQERLNATLREIERVKSSIGHQIEVIEKVELSSKLKVDLSVKVKEAYTKSAYSVIEREDHDINAEEITFLDNINFARVLREEERKSLKTREKELEDEINKNSEREREVKTAKEKLESYSEKKVKLTDERDRYQRRLETLNADIKVRRERLEFKSLKEAHEDLSKKRLQASTYERELRKVEENYGRIKESFEEIYREGNVLRVEKEKLKEKYSNCEERYDKSLKSAGLSREEFTRLRGEIKRIPEYTKRVNDYEQKLKLLEEEVEGFKRRLKGKTRPDLRLLREGEKEAEVKEREAEKFLREKEIRLENLKALNMKTKRLVPQIEEKREIYDSVSKLDGIVNKKGESFAQYVLSVYFTQVLERANQKLYQMTDGLYNLRQPEMGKLGVEVYDSSTNTLRDVKTLSGGETFMASLALALGFSEVVEEQNGGVRLDTIFIDEGFGSLDPDYLDKALRVLQELTGDRRVAIISHVELLKERISQQIVVTKKHDSSSVEMKLY